MGGEGRSGFATGMGTAVAEALALTGERRVRGPLERVTRFFGAGGEGSGAGINTDSGNELRNSCLNMVDISLMTMKATDGYSVAGDRATTLPVVTQALRGVTDAKQLVQAQ